MSTSGGVQPKERVERAASAGRCVWILAGGVGLACLVVMLQSRSCTPQVLKTTAGKEKDREWKEFEKRNLEYARTASQVRQQEERRAAEAARRKADALLAKVRASGTFLLAPGDAAWITKEGGACFAPLRADLFRFGELLGASDDFGIKQMAKEGRIFVLDEGTELLVITTDRQTVLGVPFTYEVRVMSGERKQALGYITTDAAKTLRR